ncbi:MAG: AAA family ATPase [Clostridia bacterium]|nr:AAA family ATPase [Clostridia bacterium]
MNNNFEKITRLIPIDTDAIDWSELKKTSLLPVFERMANTCQNLKYHGEADVFSHTKMVCEEIIKQPEYKNGAVRDKVILFWAALLHDIGKTTCTVFCDDEIKSPHHSSKGATMAREFLWKDLGLCGSLEKQQLREAICNLVRYHSFPPFAISHDNPELRLLKIASNGELASDFSIEKLYALERADVLGRISPSTEETLEKIEYFKALAQDIGCFKKPFEFANDFSKRAYFKGKTAWKEHDMFNDSWGTVILMSGLPGTGKDTYIKENYSHLPVISLDEIRKELNISPTAKQGKVISAGHERAKEYLRKKQPFVWNATNITSQTREMQISLFEDYGAAVKTVFLETEWNEQLSRNGNRNETVPKPVIEGLLSKLTPPERFECENVIWEIV